MLLPDPPDFTNLDVDLLFILLVCSIRAGETASEHREGEAA